MTKPDFKEIAREHLVRVHGYPENRHIESLATLLEETYDAGIEAAAKVLDEDYDERWPWQYAKMIRELKGR